MSDPSGATNGDWDPEPVTEAEQRENRIAMWRDLILNPDDDPVGPSVSVLLDSLVADVEARTAARLAAADRACKHGDLTCPCQDGDLCHYEGENPMTPPTRAADRDTALRERVEALIDEWKRLSSSSEGYRQTIGARWAADALRAALDAGDQP